ncbi:uncharacterized protein [Haliotis asinina]|uniref:uncharacterized protein n=1 Tax=Haliotis asinina TaxID=109174 RepID=UPI003531B1CB
MSSPASSLGSLQDDPELPTFTAPTPTSGLERSSTTPVRSSPEPLRSDAFVDLSRPDALAHPEVQRLLRSLLTPSTSTREPAPTSATVPAPMSAPALIPELISTSTPTPMPAPTPTSAPMPTSASTALMGTPSLVPIPAPIPTPALVQTPAPVPPPAPYRIPRISHTLSREEVLQRQLDEERARRLEAERSRRRSWSRSPRNRRSRSPHRSRRRRSRSCSRSPRRRRFRSRSRSPRRSSRTRRSRSPEASRVSLKDSSTRTPSTSSTQRRESTSVSWEDLEEQHFCPDYEEEAGVGEDDGTYLPLSAVFEWIADRLPDCPSPSVDPNNPASIRLSPELLIPPHPMVAEAVSLLDEDFAKLSLNPTIKASKSRKSDYKIHSLDFTDNGAAQDDSLKRLSSSSLSAYKVQDSKLAAIDTELKRMLKPISALASATSAAAADLSEDNASRVDHLTTIFQWQGKVLHDLLGHLRAALAMTTSVRRSGFLDTCNWQEEFKRQLLRAPFTSKFLFADKIPDIYKSHAELTNTEVALSTFEALGSAFRGRARGSGKKRYIPRRESIRSSFGRGRGRTKDNDTQRKPQERSRDTPSMPGRGRGKRPYSGR